MLKRLLNRMPKRKLLMACMATLVAVAVLVSGVTVQDKLSPQSDSAFQVSIGQKVITLGTTAYAAGTADYTCDGVADDVQFQAALNALPANGGKISVLTGNYVFSATVTRAIPNVTIDGNGLSTNYTYDGVNPIFTAGGNNWVFKNFVTDAGGINVGATTGWSQENVKLGSTYYAYRTSSDTTASSWSIPSGRSATYVIAASDAPAIWQAQADVVLTGTNDQNTINTAFTTVGFGSILFSPGTIYLTGPIVYDLNKAPSVFAGSGTQATVFYQVDGSNAASLIKTNVVIYNTCFRDFKIDGNKAGNPTAGYGIDSTNFSGGNYWDNIWVTNSKGDAFYNFSGFGSNLRASLSDGNGFDLQEGAFLTSCESDNNVGRGFAATHGNNWEIQLINCITNQNTEEGYFFFGTNRARVIGSVSSGDLSNAFRATNSALGIIFEGNSAYDTGATAFVFDGGVTSSQMIGNFVQEPSQVVANSYGIMINNSSYNVIKGNTLSLTDAGHIPYEGIGEIGTSDYNIIEGNNIVATGGVGDKIICVSGAHTIVRGNIGFVTESSVSGNITTGTTSATINHGLSYTPSLGDIAITFSNNATNAIGNWWVSNITDTQITVNVANDPGASGQQFVAAFRRQ